MVFSTYILIVIILAGQITAVAQLRRCPPWVVVVVVVAIFSYVFIYIGNSQQLQVRNREVRWHTQASVTTLHSAHTRDSHSIYTDL